MITIKRSYCLPSLSFNSQPLFSTNQVQNSGIIFSIGVLGLKPKWYYKDLKELINQKELTNNHEFDKLIIHPQLNDKFDGEIPDNFALCHISELENWLINNRSRDLGYKCDFCNCGKEHNDLIYNLIKGIEDVDFV